MITLELPFRNKVRLTTTGDRCTYAVHEEFATLLPSIPGAALVNRFVTLEWLSPRGGHFLYGLLGARAQPTDGNYVDLHVLVGQSDHAAPRTNLADAIDRVHVGLPAVYARAVLASATDVFKRASFPASIVRFDTALHGEVGSSSMVFERLAEATTRLLAMPIRDDPQNIRDLMNETLLR